MSLRLALVSAAVLLAAAIPVRADDRQVLVESFSKAFGKGSYRAEVQSKVSGRDYTTRMDVQLPDRFQMKTPDAEIIVLPAGTWVNAGGQWMKMPMPMSQMTQGFSRQAIDEGLASLAEVSRVGEDTVAGCASTLYRYRTSGTFMGVKNDSEAEVAICGDNGYPLRVRTLSGEPVTIHYDFDAKIDIQPPR